MGLCIFIRGFRGASKINEEVVVGGGGGGGYIRGAYNQNQNSILKTSRQGLSKYLLHLKGFFNISIKNVTINRIHFNTEADGRLISRRAYNWRYFLVNRSMGHNSGGGGVIIRSLRYV